MSRVVSIAASNRYPTVARALGITEQTAEMLSLQAQLAYSAARSDIETCCAWAGDAPGRWYDTSNVLDNDPESIADALRYLDLRGLIERHDNGVWVRVREEDAPVVDAGKVAA